jgi:hypothetical protein
MIRQPGQRRDPTGSVLTAEVEEQLEVFGKPIVAVGRDRVTTGERVASTFVVELRGQVEQVRPGRQASGVSHRL